MYTKDQLEAFAVQLRDVGNRRTFSQATIEKVCDIYLANNELSPTAVKVLANYVSDIEENASFVYNRIHEVFPITTKDGFYATVQIVLLNNILTTNRDCVTKEDANVLIQKITKVASSIEEMDEDVIVEALEDLSELANSVHLDTFMHLRQLMLKNKTKQGFNVVLTLSGKIKCDGIDEKMKERAFFELYDSLKAGDSIAEQIMLNVSYELGINDTGFFVRLLEKVFVQGNLVAECKPTALLIVSNEVISKVRMECLLHAVNIPKLINQYFIDIYPKLSFKRPWELQSIVLFTKFPADKVKLDDASRRVYIDHLKQLLTPTAVQLNIDVSNLQLTFLSRTFSGEQDTDALIKYFKSKGKEYSLEFRYTLNKFYFSYLTRNRNNMSSDQVQETIQEAKELLEESKSDRVPIHITYMLELSKLFGIYAQQYAKEEWFRVSFGTFESMVKDVQGKTDDSPVWEILTNNIRFTSSFM
ncbi:hypothetical protein CANINC_003988 [Pichia inconspicua]|uniref:Uncharacterized protein n=1 Tax=Pichia inconspicua TaxID=52247 RepID=A0A4T0WX92_9ASCO|nr:hypothetical protein CANINC_003988 [[Candida] inconspicua]